MTAAEIGKEQEMTDREEFEAWYASQDQSEPEPEKTYELSESGMEDLTKDCLFQGWRAARAQPAEQEPVANLHDDGYWTACKTSTGRALNDRLLFAGSLKVPVYTQPPRRELLSDEQIDRITDAQWGNQPVGAMYAAHRAYARAIEAAIEATKGGAA